MSFTLFSGIIYYLSLTTAVVCSIVVFVYGFFNARACVWANFRPSPSGIVCQGFFTYHILATGVKIRPSLVLYILKTSKTTSKRVVLYFSNKQP